jgi:hypothetical protein
MLYLCEALFSILIQHLVNLKGNPINTKYLLAHLKLVTNVFQHNETM